MANMTVADIRKRTQKIKDSIHGRRKCAACNNTGWVESGHLTNREIAEATGMTESKVSQFLTGNTDLRFTDGLALTAWLNDQEYKLRLAKAAGETVVKNDENPSS